jgi:hypothetical protein
MPLTMTTAAMRHFSSPEYLSPLHWAEPVIYHAWKTQFALSCARPSASELFSKHAIPPRTTIEHRELWQSSRAW